MEWRTKVTDLLGCKYPIIEGSFGRFGTSALATPICQAGGFGLITAAALRTPERLREDIRRLKSKTDQPFGVNLTVSHCPHVDEMREVAIEEGARAIETSEYVAAEHGRRIKEAGLVWIHKVAAMKHALAAERQGADAVVIVGIEGVGSKGANQVSTLTNITAGVRLLKVPLIAAGGIGDARGFLAALAMGAEAAYLGTAFMATVECPLSQRYKQHLVDADCFAPEFRERVFGSPDPRRDESLRRGETPSLVARSAHEAGVNYGSMAAGVITKVVTVKELIDGIIQEAEEIIKSRSWGVGPS